MSKLFLCLPLDSTTKFRKKPSGGFSIWVTLPERLSSTQLLRQAVEHGVEFAPGSYFHVGRRETNNMRLAFSTLTQPQLRQGVKRLGKVISQALDAGRRQAAGDR